jgi:hypothetical protein
MADAGARNDRKAKTRPLAVSAPWSERVAGHGESAFRRFVANPCRGIHEHWRAVIEAAQRIG